MRKSWSDKLPPADTFVKCSEIRRRRTAVGDDFNPRKGVIIMARKPFSTTPVAEKTTPIASSAPGRTTDVRNTPIPRQGSAPVGAQKQITREQIARRAY